MQVTSTDYAEQLRQLQKLQQQGLNSLDKQAEFSKFLEEGQSQAAPLGEKNATDAAANAKAATLVNQSGLAGMIMAAQGLTESQKTPQEQLTGTLDAMEEYAMALGDESKTLKDIEPLAEDMRRQAGRLAETSQSLSDDDPMKEMTNDAAIMATVEAMKFRRGDYV